MATLHLLCDFLIQRTTFCTGSKFLVIKKKPKNQTTNKQPTKQNKTMKHSCSYSFVLFTNQKMETPLSNSRLWNSLTKDMDEHSMTHPEAFTTDFLLLTHFHNWFKWNLNLWSLSSHISSSHMYECIAKVYTEAVSSVVLAAVFWEEHFVLEC